MSHIWGVEAGAALAPGLRGPVLVLGGPGTGKSTLLVEAAVAHIGAGVIDAVAALTWDIPPGPASAPYNVRRLPPPVVEPGPDRRPITAVALVAVGLTLALGLGALARRALSRR